MSNLIFSESLSSIAVKILSNACQILSNPVKSCQCVKFSYGLPRAPSSNVNGSNPSKILKAFYSSRPFKSPFFELAGADHIVRAWTHYLSQRTSVSCTFLEV